MIKKTIITLFLTIVSLAAFSQQCNCTVNFEALIKQVTENYPGFPDKITPVKNKAFRNLTDSLRKAAISAGETTCFRIMDKWIQFFDDLHLGVVLNSQPASAAFIRAVFEGEQKIPLQRDSLVKRYSTYGIKDPMEGIWQMDGGNFEVAIVRMQNSNTFAGVTLKADSLFWMPGQVKFTLHPLGNKKYRVVFKSKQHTTEESNVVLQPETGILKIDDSRWVKTLPVTGVRKPEEQLSFYFKELDSQTNVLRLSSFLLDFKGLVDSIIGANMTAITGKPYLIVDVRDNKGGYNIAFEKLLPLLYTKPVISSGIKILATPDNIALYEGLLTNNNIDSLQRQKIAELIRQLKEKKNGYLVEEDEVYKQDTIYRYPQKIAILVNEKSASSTEHLVLKAKQSSKCVIMGHRTAGIIDYTNIVGPRSLPCNHYLLYCPTGKSNRLPLHPIDNIGIAPDVVISDLEADWIATAARELKNH